MYHGEDVKNICYEKEIRTYDAKSNYTKKLFSLKIMGYFEPSFLIDTN